MVLKINHLLTGFLFLFFLIGCAGGQSELFVSPNGNDTNSGTFDSPLKTLATAMGKIKKGGTVCLRGVSLLRSTPDINL